MAKNNQLNLIASIKILRVVGFINKYVISEIGWGGAIQY